MGVFELLLTTCLVYHQPGKNPQGCTNQIDREEKQMVNRFTRQKGLSSPGCNQEYSPNQHNNNYRFLFHFISCLLLMDELYNLIFTRCYFQVIILSSSVSSHLTLMHQHQPFLLPILTQGLLDVHLSAIQATVGTLKRHQVFLQH
jgi:hypothetical protein